MSDSPPEHIKMETGKCDDDEDNDIVIVPGSLFRDTSNIWMNETIIKTLGQFGSRAALEVLRQTNGKYFEMLNSTYWDSVDKGLAFKFYCFDEFDQPNYETGARIFEAAPSVQELKNREIDDEEWGKITNFLQNWTPNKAHIFRKLDLKCVWMDKWDSTTDGLNLKAVVAELAPYITKLILNDFPVSSKNSGEKFAKFVNSFTRLKNLEIQEDRYFSNSESSMSLDQLEIGLENLKLNPKITLLIRYIRGVLTKFATKQIAIKLIVHLNETDEFELFQNACTQFGNLKNIYYRINATADFIVNLAQLETFTKLCLKLGGQIQELTLEIYTGFDSQFQEQDQLGIKNCLTQLSHQITILYIRLSKEKSWDILNPDCEWPKLKALDICEYEYPVGILKKCPNLENLYFESNQDSCIFNNKQQSDVEKLEEYFKNLSKLVQLSICRTRSTDKIDKGNELEGHLKQILPQLKVLEFWNYPWDDDDSDVNDSDPEE